MVSLRSRSAMLAVPFLLATTVVVAPSHLDAGTHPLHATLTELRYDARAAALSGTIRVFVSDLALAVAKHTGAPPAIDAQPSDAAIMAYVSAMVKVSDGRGHTVSFVGCGTRRNADLLWICLRAATRGPAAELTLSNQLLCDLFDDQVNVVQILDGDRRGSLLFTRGEGPKRLL